MEKHIYFVRHGESDSNADGVFKGSAAELTDKGREQAGVIAGRIQKIGVDAILSSPFPRARQTADAVALACNLAVEESELFVERRRPSAMKGKSYREPEVVEIIRQTYDGYLIPGYRHSDEENLEDLQKRANAALDLLVAHPSARICVVTHGMFMRILFAAALDREFTGRDLQKVIDGLENHNTSVSYFRREARFGDPADVLNWRVISWNDSAHLG